jgi:hypothetical protein
LCCKAEQKSGGRLCVGKGKYTYSRFEGQINIQHPSTETGKGTHSTTGSPSLRLSRICLDLSPSSSPNHTSQQLHSKVSASTRTAPPSAVPTTSAASTTIHRSRKSFGLDQEMAASPSKPSQNSLQDLIPLVNSTIPPIQNIFCPKDDTLTCNVALQVCRQPEIAVLLTCTTGPYI